MSNEVIYRMSNRQTHEVVEWTELNVGAIARAIAKSRMLMTVEDVHVFTDLINRCATDSQTVEVEDWEYAIVRPQVKPRSLVVSSTSVFANPLNPTHRLDVVFLMFLEWLEKDMQIAYSFFPEVINKANVHPKWPEFRRSLMLASPAEGRAIICKELGWPGIGQSEKEPSTYPIMVEQLRVRTVMEGLQERKARILELEAELETISDKCKVSLHEEQT